MTVTLRKTPMTREAFFPWAEAQDARYEFDGLQPVAMTGGSIAHSLICQNLWAALRTRLRGTRCICIGPDAGLATIGDAVRYPDALVTCTDFAPEARLVPGVMVVFEVISPGSGRTDRIDKVREYRGVPTILRYVIIERTTMGLTSFERPDSTQAWLATTLTAGDTLRLPEIGIEIPVADLYDAIDLPAADGSPAE